MALEGLIKLKEKFVRRALRKFPDSCTFEEFRNYIYTSMGVEFDESFLKECYDEFKEKEKDEKDLTIF
jgi:DNA helicase IV